MRPAVTLALPVLVACSHKVYSPPASAFGLGPVTSLPSGGRSLDIEVAQHSAFWDPPLVSGAGRFSQSIGPRTDVGIEGTAFSLGSAGASKENRTIYAGRASVRTSPGEDLALFAGAGGGYAPAGGGFTTLDAGISVGIHNCYVVPVLQGSAFVSQPLSPHAIDVTTDPMSPTYDTPSRTFGATVRGGLRVSVTPAACKRGEAGTWIYAGVDVTGVRDADSSDQISGLGIGLSTPL